MAACYSVSNPNAVEVGAELSTAPRPQSIERGVFSPIFYNDHRFSLISLYTILRLIAFFNGLFFHQTEIFVSMLLHPRVVPLPGTSTILSAADFLQSQ